MKPMHLLAASLTLLLAITQNATAQKTSGTITYEGMQRIDPSENKIIINGNVVKPGSPDAPQLPDVRTFSQKLIFAGNFAREVRETPTMVMRRLEGPGGEPANVQTRRFVAPFSESLYFDLSQKKIYRILEVKKEAEISTYQAEEAFPVTNGWKDTGKTRKVAGYNCQRATGKWKGEEYTIWYTRGLPFTYSPIAALMPPQGVVLQVESNNESFRATGVTFSDVPETEVTPALTAQKVSAQELNKLRDKARADFRQQTFSGPSLDK